MNNTNNSVFYLLQDHLKSSSVFVDQAGNTLATNYYYPYGGNRGGTAFSGLSTKRFTGQYHESALLGGEGLSYYNARWYDAQLGRFLSADTMVPGPANPQALNRYSYVNNNPLRFVDPTGHSLAVFDPGSGGGSSRLAVAWKVKNRGFPSGYPYYVVPGFGLFDWAHIKAGINRSRYIRGQVEAASQQGGGTFPLKATTKKSWTTGSATTIFAEYSVNQQLTSAQINQVTLGIIMHFHPIVEAHQDSISQASAEDLPSDYLGYYIYLNPGQTPQRALTELAGGKELIPKNNASGLYWKRGMPANHEFRPMLHDGQMVDWPAQFQMTPLDSSSGLWTNLSVTVDPVQRHWVQEKIDWAVIALEKVVE